MCLAVLCFGLAPWASALEIREFLAENETGLLSEDGKTEDWIEIYNNSGSSVDLGGYHLTDDQAEPMKWRFPTMDLAAGGTLVVFASSENRRDPADNLHTNFKLGRGGEYLALTDPAGAVVDAFDPAYPPQFEDVSYSDAGYHNTPTPGAANNAAVVGLPPRIRHVTDQPGMPTLGSEIVVTARVTRTSGPISSVTCIVRKMYGGETSLPMSLIGDDIYITSFTATGLDAGEMIRWRIEARDISNRKAESPAYAEDPLDRDRYYGTVVADPSLASSQMPILHWFMANPANAATEAGERGSVYFLGRFYDNITADIHGQSTRSFPKKSYDLDFNRGNRFVWREGEKKVKDVNLLSNWADKTKFRNTLAWETLGKIGAPTHFAQAVRVQQNGAFFSTADMVEDGDDRFLERNGLDGDGALYKMYNPLTSSTTGAEKKTRDWEGNSDLQGLINGLNSADPVRYSWDNLDLPMTLTTLAGYVLIQSRDQGHKNYYVYRDSDDTGEWGLVAWDNDLTFGHNWAGTYFDDTLYTNDSTTFGSQNVLKSLMFNDSVFRSMLNRRLRTIMDEWMKPPGTPAADLYFENRVQDMLAMIDPPGITSDADRDYSKWGSWGNNNRMRTECNRVLNNYFNQRRNYVYNNLGLPSAQSPNVSVDFGVVEVTPASGNQREEYIEILNPNNTPVDISGWSVTGGVEHVFAPGTVIPASGSGRNRLFLAKDSATFRARSVSPRGNQNRFVQEGYDGQLSSRGETLYLMRPNGTTADTKTTPNNASAPQNLLRVTELHYHPSPATLAERAVDPGLTADDFEFIELHNLGTSSLSVGGVQLIEGVRYVIPGGTQIPAEGYLILAKNPVAFAMRHPSPNGAQVLGPYEGYLGNGGERVQLQDALGEPIQDFDYDDLWYPDTDGAGTSLEIIDPEGDLALWDLAVGWRASGAPGGTPGTEVLPPFTLQAVPQLSSPESQQLTYDLVVEDPVNPPRALLYALQGNVPQGVSISAQGRLAWTPPEAAGPGNYTFSVVVSDTFIPPNAATQTVQIAVSEANRLPVFSTIAAQQVDEQTAWSLALNASDPDLPAQSVSITLVSGPPGMTLAGSTLSWTPTEVQGPKLYTVQVRAEDSLGGQRNASFQIEVMEVNRPAFLPVVAAQQIPEQVAWSFDLNGSDPDLPVQNLSYQVLQGPSGLTVSGNTLNWTPSEAQGPGTYSVQVRVEDPAGAGRTRTFSIAVDEANRQPNLAAIAAQQVDELSPWSITLSGSDPDLPAQSLSYSLVDGPSGMTLSGTTLQWTPSEAQGPGSYSVRVRVEDELGARRTRLFTITANEVNDPPVITSPANLGRIDERTVWTHRVVAQDTEQQAITYALGANAPPGMVIDAGTGWIRWFPDATVGGSTAVFDVTATDAVGAASTPQTMTLQVDDVATAGGGPCGVDVDLVPAGATWSWTTAPGSGSAWREPWNDSSAWASGPAPLGYGEPGLGTVTTVNQLRTVFVKTFTVVDVHDLSDVRLSVRRDDAVIVYLNGEEIARDNLPLGVVDGTTQASSSVFGGDEQRYYDFVISEDRFAEGQNTIAVGVHQVVVNSNDMSFDAELVATRAGPCNPPAIDPSVFAAQGMVKFNTDAGSSYEVQACDDLVGGVWVPLSTFTATGSTHEYSDPTSGTAMRRVYRVRRLP